MKPDVARLGEFLRSLLGPIVWAAHFFVMYGAEALVCTGPGVSPRDMRWIAAATTAIAVAILVVFIIRQYLNRPSGGTGVVLFLHDVATALAILSIAAIAAVALPAAHLPGCLPPLG